MTGESRKWMKFRIATLLAFFSLAIGILNAAGMTY